MGLPTSLSYGKQYFSFRTVVSAHKQRLNMYLAELTSLQEILPCSKNSHSPKGPSLSSSVLREYATTREEVGVDRSDTQKGMLSGISQERNLRSKIWWFTEFCNSHYVSHFAAFFIVARTKISVAKSCFFVFLLCKVFIASQGLAARATDTTSQRQSPVRQKKHRLCWVKK